MGQPTRGVALISTLFFLIIIAFFVIAAIQLSPTQQTSAAHFEEAQLATTAAESGVQYARARLREDISWRPTPDGRVTVVDQPDLVIVEDHGNVVGLLRTGEAGYSQFRIRFNYQDGTDGDDGLDDPTPQGFLTLAHVSTNNLTNGGAVPVVRETGGVVSPTAASVPGNEALLIVEGRAGPALRDHQPLAPNAPPGPGRLTTRTIRAALRPAFTEGLDAAIMAAGDLKVVIPEYEAEPGSGWPMAYALDVRSRSSEVAPRVRTKGTLDIEGYMRSGPNYQSANGFASTLGGVLGTGVTPDPTLAVEPESPGAGFYQMSWSQVDQADPDPVSTEAISLNAGTYIVEDDGTLTYYDMDYDDYRTHIAINPTDPGQPLSADLREVRNNLSQVGSGLSYWSDPSAPWVRARLTVSKDISIRDTGNASGFTFMPRVGFVDGPADLNGDVPGQDFGTTVIRGSNLQVQFSPEGEQATFSAQGDIRLGSRLNGEGGSLTSTGDIDISPVTVGQEFSSSTGGRSVNMYARGDIDLNTWVQWNEPNRGHFSSLQLNGVVYAWGDIECQLGLKDRSNVLPGFRFRDNGGRMIHRGALVAYGGDPGSASDSTPGAGTGGVGPGKGNITLTSRHPLVIYDGAYVSGLDESALPDALDVVAWSIVETR